jgi:hypothetical protein
LRFQLGDTDPIIIVANHPFDDKVDRPLTLAFEPIALFLKLGPIRARLAMTARETATCPPCVAAMATAPRLAASSVRGMPKMNPDSAPAAAAAAPTSKSAPRNAARLGEAVCASSPEVEADAVADQVMRMPDPACSIAPAPPQIGRKSAE